MDIEFQKQGIGTRLIEETKEQLSRIRAGAASPPKANDYYPKLGFEHNPRAWMLKRRSASLAKRPSEQLPYLRIRRKITPCLRSDSC